MDKTRGSIRIDRARCKGCGLCISVCRRGGIRLADNVDDRGIRVAHRDTSIRCKIAGTVPEEDGLTHLAQDLGLGDRVEFLGFVPDELLLALYANCGAVYFAPRDEDYGYITLEAFLSKKPVITSTDAGGPLEFVEDGANGIVLPSLDDRTLGRAMESLLRDKAKCAALGNSGYKRVKDIGWDRVIRTLIGENPL